jgi:prolyl-tRNA synthetase
MRWWAEITMPVVNPGDIWKETNRWYEIGPEMARFQDRNGRDMALAMTHEEVVGDLVRKEINSYRQLPALIYHIQTKWRDEPRPRAGVIRTREFTMKDSYSLDVDEAGLDHQYRAHYQAYFSIFHRCRLRYRRRVGYGHDGRSWRMIRWRAPSARTRCCASGCRYSASKVARCRRRGGDPLPMEKVATPDATTIEPGKVLGI